MSAPNEHIESNIDAERAFLASSKARTEKNEARAKEAEERRAANSSEDESVTLFLKGFNATYFSALSKLEGVDPTKVAVTARDRSAVLDVLGEAHRMGLELRERTASASLFLNPFDVRTCEGKIDDVLKKVMEVRKAVIPRERFTFKSRRKEGEFFNMEQEKEGADVEEDEEGGKNEEDDEEEKYSMEFSNLSGERQFSHVKKPPFNNGDIRLKDIKDSAFALLDVYGAVRLANLTNCDIYLGMIKGPLYVENVKDCRIFATSRQLRIHDTVGVDFYVHTASGPIIEHCDKCRFGPRVHWYEGMEVMEKESGLKDINGGKSMYADVQDFRWLKKMQSPHWEVLNVESGEGGAVEESKFEGIEVRTMEAKKKRDREKQERKKNEAVAATAREGEEGEESSEDEL